VNLQ